MGKQKHTASVQENTLTHLKELTLPHKPFLTWNHQKKQIKRLTAAASAAAVTGESGRSKGKRRLRLSTLEACAACSQAVP